MPAHSPYSSASSWKPFSWKLWVGSIALIGVGSSALLGLVSPGFARPAGRITQCLVSALEAERADDLVLAVEGLEGIRSGLPVFSAEPHGGAQPIAHVLDLGRNEAGPWLRLRFEPGASPVGPWRLRVYAPSRSMRSAYEMAITPQAARRFGDEIAARLETLWKEVLLPESEKRLPDFLARINPQGDTEAHALTQAMTASVMRRLDPLLEQLASHVAAAVKRKFDLLDRLGMLWKVMRGDADGLQGQIMPVAKQSAKAWWSANQSAVLRAIGDGLKTQLSDLKSWAGGELFQAAREELFQPILRSQRERLEREGESLLRLAAHEFMESPHGGFRVRFAALLRTQLLNKQTALLLLERVEPAR